MDLPSDIPKELIREQLETILAHDIFAKSARISDLLRFIVNESLEGRGDAIKEQVILCEVFGSQDGPEINTVVRTTARRLRDKLREFYGGKAEHRVLIALPKGSYIPAFELLRGGSGTSGLDGTWRAEITYENAHMTFPRFQTREEIFTFEVDGDEVHGSATFHGAKRALYEGRLKGDRLKFITKISGLSDEDQMIARYRGRYCGDEIQFVLDVDGGPSAGTPLEFTAARIAKI